MELSIIIPTLNRAASLKKTLQSIIDQENGDELFEVIVVDNGSTDDTKDVCLFAAEQLDNFVYNYDAEPGQLTGRHKGTELSRGDIISFIDDDVELNPHWITSMLYLFNQNRSVAIIGGPCLPKYQLYPPSWVSYFWQSTPYGGNMCLPLSLIDIGGNNQLEIDPLYVFGLNYSIRKKLLLELGGFHPDCLPQQLQKYQGDGETGLSLKAKSRGIKALYATSVLLYHQVSAERLTRTYFEKWYYYSGVCQSFTDIRSKYKLLPNNESYVSPSVTHVRQLIIKTGNILKRTFEKTLHRLPGEVIQFQSDFVRKYNEGYQFHQLSFEKDTNVKRLGTEKQLLELQIATLNVKKIIII